MAPSALEKLVAKRDVIENNLCRINDKIKDHVITPIAPNMIDRHEMAVDRDIAELRAIHAEICVLAPQTELDNHKTIFSNLCDAADFMMNSLHGIKMSAVQSTPTASPFIANSPSVTKLPNLDLNNFDGNLSEWISFRDMFYSAVHCNPRVFKIQKLVYLKSLLKGEAAKLVHSLILSESNYDTAWKLLHDGYQYDREILFCILKKLFNLPSSNSSATTMRQIVDTTKECMRSMEILNLKPEKSTEAIILFIVLERLDPASRQLWEQSFQGTVVPLLSDLFELMEQRSRALAASKSIPSSSKLHRVYSEPTRRVHTYHGQSNSTCKTCNGPPHPLYKCPKFQSLKIDGRYDPLKKMNSCFNCLGTGHSSKTFSNPHRCKHCQQKHHSLLHTESKPTEKETVQTHSTFKNPMQGLLVTAITSVAGNDGQHHLARAFLDSGSTASFVSSSFVNQLGLQRKKSRVEVVGLGATNVGTTQGAVTWSTAPYFDKSKPITVEALVIPKVSQNLPDKQQNPSSYCHLENIKLADPSWYQPAPVDLLLGSDVFWNIVGTNRLNGPQGTPSAVESKLGWLVAGTTTSSCKTKVEVHHTCDISLDKQLKKFWEIETINVVSHTPHEKQCQDHFEKTHGHTPEGKFVVSLPFKSHEPSVGNSYQMALRRLKSLERRLAANKDHRTEYNKFMKEYEKLGHMTDVTYRKSESSSPVVYIPHHFILKNESTTTKFRVVFEASSKTSNLRSLNDALLVGPTLQDSLVDIVFRFRQLPVAFTADIAKMYRQIEVKPEDRKFQHILWREDTDEPIRDFELNTVTYGTACAPCLAVKCLRTLAETNATKFPIGAEIVLKNFYVDDVMNSCSNISTAIQAQSELRSLCSAGGFSLRKWTSNKKEVLEAIPEDLREKSPLLDLTIDPSVKTLGIIWNTITDCFQFWYKNDIIYLPTKRLVLSDIAKLYDPLGWLAPVVIQAKIFMQDLWKLGITWDELLPVPETKQWDEMKNNIMKIDCIEIPRFNLPLPSSEIMLAGFSDASEKAYAACVYIASYSHDCFHSSLLDAKTRVATVKTISIPKLELCGSVLLVELMNAVSKALDVKISNYHAWTESTIVLSWLQSPPSNWKPFVANQISQIQSNVIPIQWHHVVSEDNPADCASRGLHPFELVKFPLWWTGPSFLKDKNFDQLCYTLNESQHESIRCEARSVKQSCFLTSSVEESEFLRSSSNLNTAVRIAAWCRRFIHNSRRSKSRQSGPLTICEFDETMRYIVKRTQTKFFNDEIKCLQSNHPVLSKSPLANLNPFLDKHGVIRVGGRLRNSQLSENRKFPVILPRHSKLTEMLITHNHLKFLHAGPTLTQSLIQR